jgi:hypothetical protein
MAKHFRLVGRTGACKTVLKRSLDFGDYVIGRVCKTKGSWSYQRVEGPVLSAPTKRAALKRLLLQRKSRSGNRSALEGARRRRRRAR